MRRVAAALAAISAIAFSQMRQQLICRAKLQHLLR